MDLIFTDQKNEKYEEGIQLSTKDLMWRMNDLRDRISLSENFFSRTKFKAFAT